VAHECPGHPQELAREESTLELRSAITDFAISTCHARDDTGSWWSASRSKSAFTAP